MDINEVRNQISGKSVEEQLAIMTNHFPGRAIFTTSFGLEDQVITHLIFKNNIQAEVATLDTGRLFPETYKVFNETLKKYMKPVTLFFPDRTAVEKLVTEKGPYSFYYSGENRIECCRIRKILPLNRALEGKDCWITGIRADQSNNRQGMDALEYDAERKLFKFHPLFRWTFEEVRNFIAEHNIPYNSLHDKGFVSIGCEPCTRAVREGEDFRAGRWWWEAGGKKECGLHAGSGHRARSGGQGAEG
ncbi:MAG: phosphoadenylyl-sulfate reductase [Bacteroidales bacterium]|nr:phosphoadenylyl-sulfate reductase [Bacteroidales bacterium]